jgi:hypothetical protein
LLVNLDLMPQVSPEPGEKPVLPVPAAEMVAVGALGELLRSTGGQDLRELGVHSAFLSIASNVI